MVKGINKVQKDFQSPDDRHGAKLYAAIDIGSTAIRMDIAHPDTEDGIKTVDSLQQNVTIGRDTFRKGEITKATTDECIETLNSFKRVIREYGIDTEKRVRIVATSAVSEASNVDTFLDRIAISTGFDIEVMSGAEINRLFYYMVIPLIKALEPSRKKLVYAIEIGGGTTRIIGFKDHKVFTANTYKLGSFRLLKESLVGLSENETKFRSVLNSEIDKSVRTIIEDMQSPEKATFIFLGGEARLVAGMAGNSPDDPISSVDTGDFSSIAERIIGLPVSEKTKEYDLFIEEAEMAGPAILAMSKIADSADQKTIYTGRPTMRDGLLREMIIGGAWTDGFVDQIVNSIYEIGRKYAFDEEHARYVSDIALKIFNAMQDEHGLSKHYEVILQVAALLHDTGDFINKRGHHKHSQYIIRNSEIFGFSPRDTEIASLIARYHRKAKPKSSHPEYANLRRKYKFIVLKLASILRVADALDRNHNGRCLDFDVRVFKDRMEITVNKRLDLSIERRSLKNKGDMFSEVYGKKVMLYSIAG